MHKARSQFFDVSRAIDPLKEPSLKGFIFEAERQANDDPDFGHLYRALAEMAKEQLQILREKRSSKGTWYALVEVMHWREHVGEAIERQHERCTSKAAAITAARRLLAEHVGKFSDDITVEADLLTETEWQRRSIFFKE
jgi:hypothetical protein